jgi:hypothetical protein
LILKMKAAGPERPRRFSLPAFLYGREASTLALALAFASALAFACTGLSKLRDCAGCEVSAVAGVGFASEPVSEPDALPLPFADAPWLGAGCVAGVLDACVAGIAALGRSVLGTAGSAGAVLGVVGVASFIESTPLVSPPARLPLAAPLTVEAD